MKANFPVTYLASWQCPLPANTTDFHLGAFTPYLSPSVKGSWLIPSTIGGANWTKCNYSPFDSDWLRLPGQSLLAHGILPASWIIWGLVYDHTWANEAQKDTFGALLKREPVSVFLRYFGVWIWAPRGAAVPSISLRIKTLWRRAEKSSRENKPWLNQGWSLPCQ